MVNYEFIKNGKLFFVELTDIEYVRMNSSNTIIEEIVFHKKPTRKNRRNSKTGLNIDYVFVDDLKNMPE